MTEPAGKVELTPEQRRLSAGRAGRLRAYLKAAIDAGDWEAAEEVVTTLKAESADLALALPDSPVNDQEQRLQDLERAFAAILSGMQPGGQKHPHADAVTEGKPVRFVFTKSREGKLVVNFIPLEIEG